MKKTGFYDPLCENKFEKRRGLIHRYPDRVVLTVTGRCFAYCRFCFRKKNWSGFNGFDLSGAVEYIKENKNIQEVLISGGDPFFLSDEQLGRILAPIKAIDHVKFIRIGTRVLSSNPLRIDNNCVSAIAEYKPLWIAAHINHTDEITKEFVNSASMIIDAGIPIVAQTVLLKGINDNADILERLFCKLVEIGIKPYYLFGCDYAQGNGHFRVPIESAVKIINKLRGSISGLCVPNFSFDLPQGGGKIIVEPDRLRKRYKNRYVFVNFEGKEFDYDDV